MCFIEATGMVYLWLLSIENEDKYLSWRNMLGMDFQNFSKIALVIWLISTIGQKVSEKFDFPKNNY